MPARLAADSALALRWGRPPWAPRQSARPARQLLQGFPADLSERPVWISLSYLVDGEIPPISAFAGQAATLGVLDAKNSNIEGYVTEQALNGLFEMIAKQEETIRANPAAAATGLAKKVFGAL